MEVSGNELISKNARKQNLWRRITIYIVYVWLKSEAIRASFRWTHESFYALLRHRFVMRSPSGSCSFLVVMGTCTSQKLKWPESFYLVWAYLTSDVYRGSLPDNLVTEVSARQGWILSDALTCQNGFLTSRTSSNMHLLWGCFGNLGHIKHIFFYVGVSSSSTNQLVTTINQFSTTTNLLAHRSRALINSLVQWWQWW